MDFIVLETRRLDGELSGDGQMFFCDTVCMNQWKKAHNWSINTEEEVEQVFDGPDDSLAPDQHIECLNCEEVLDEGADY